MAHYTPAAPLKSAPSSTAASQLLPAVLRESDAARYIGLSRAYLRKSRLINQGPNFVRVRRAVMYRVADLDRFLEKHVVKVA